MSKKIWGICLSAFALLILTVVFSYWYFGRDTSVPPGEQRGTELVEMVPARTAPDQVSSTSEKEEQKPLTPEPETEEQKETAETDGYEFVLVNHDEYVTVYRLPENEVYEYTDVILDVLPLGLQEEIRQGKYLKNEEELYNFLENYTS
ncbi:MAG TPA: hypothetical protein DD414_11005 [Lachnospiraceae bacterium]|nr:hypothetical protein [Lachnospiraceae bacterium]